MALTAIDLDDRKFQDIVDDVKKRIHHYCPEWTDHNVSDPGVTMIELFAWMTEMMLYRLNQMPERHYIKFLDFLGVQLAEPKAATVPVTFWLTAPPKEEEIIIKAGTQVASTQTESERSIVFTTDAGIKVQCPDLKALIRRVDPQKGEKKDYDDLSSHLRRLEVGLDDDDELPATFSPKPSINDALYFGFGNNLSQHILRLVLDCDPAGGAKVNPSKPPYVWEAAITQGEHKPLFEPCDVEIDTTQALSQPGWIQLHLPQMKRSTVKGQKLYWVRVKIKDISPNEDELGMRNYQNSPKLRKIRAESWGVTGWARHAQSITNEVLGTSDGSPGQRFQLQVTPILRWPPEDPESLKVRVESEPPQIWEEIGSFVDSGEKDLCFTLDHVSGELRFGPSIRQPNGEMKHYGDIPPRGARLVVENYWTGGGQVGNVRAGFLNTLKEGDPKIARVENLKPARGGKDKEELEAAKLNLQKKLRSRERAVTAADFEYFAKERSVMGGKIARVKCIGRPGTVEVLVIPHQPEPDGYLDPKQLKLKPELKKSVENVLSERCLLGTNVNVRSPTYRWVAVKVEVTAGSDTNQIQLAQDLEACLYRFLNPLTGGPDGQGWPFGRRLSHFDIYSCLPNRPDLSYNAVKIYLVGTGGESDGVLIEKELPLAPDEVIASGQHRIVITDNWG